MKKYILLFLFIAFELNAQSANPYILGIEDAAASTLNDNIIAFWKLGEASGTRVDVVGSNDLTDNNTVTQAAGKIGNAAQFVNANTEYLSIVDNTDLSTGDIDFTLACWVYLDNKSSDQTPMAKWLGAGNHKEYSIRFKNGATDPDDRFEFRVSNDGGTNITVTADNFGEPAAATWYFVVAWHDATANTINIQINNGTADSFAHSTGVNDDTSEFNIGAGDNGGSDLLDGRIDAAGLWKRVLTASEKTELYNSGNGLQYPF